MIDLFFNTKMEYESDDSSEYFDCYSDILDEEQPIAENRAHIPRTYQLECLFLTVDHKQGVFELFCGTGKSMIM